MAKRKRLGPPTIIAPATTPESPAEAPLETKSYPLGVAPTRRAPIAQVAGEAASQAALEELADEIKAARAEGRMVLALPLETVQADHLCRDRMAHEDEDMAALKASIAARGQQTPIEVVELSAGGYGLISGWRRLTALQELSAETGEARFAKVQALIKPLDTVSDSYVAMVEENEIRVNLSHYERARIACEAARLKVYGSAGDAVAALFANASYAKRSKINSFVRVHEALGEALTYPTAISERLGLALAGALDKDPGLGPRIRQTLRKNPVNSAEDERKRLERALVKTGAPARANAPARAKVAISEGLAMESKAGRVVLSGKGVDEGLIAALQDWLSQRS